MSRQVIRDVVIPIIEKIVWQQRNRPYYRIPKLEDPHLEEFLEEELRRHFAVVGANECQHLREQLEEARRNDPTAFELLLRRLLRKYVNIATRVRSAKKLKKTRNKGSDKASKKKQERAHAK